MFRRSFGGCVVRLPSDRGRCFGEILSDALLEVLQDQTGQRFGGIIVLDQMESSFLVGVADSLFQLTLFLSILWSPGKEVGALLIRVVGIAEIEESLGLIVTMIQASMEDF